MKAVIIITLVLFILSIITMIVGAVNKKHYNNSWEEPIEFVGSMICLLEGFGIGWILLCI